MPDGVRWDWVGWDGIGLDGMVIIGRRGILRAPSVPIRPHYPLWPGRPTTTTTTTMMMMKGKIRKENII